MRDQRVRCRAMPVAVVWLWIGAAAGCQSCDRGGEPSSAGTTASSGAGAEESPGAGSSPGSGVGGDAPPMGPAPEGVRIAGEPGRYRQVAVSVEAHGSAPVRLRSAVSVERATGSGFEAVAVEGLTLRPDCEHEPPDCIELGPGAELRPPPWTGQLGQAQCGCVDCAAAPAGEYRFVAQSCEGHRVEGESFRLSE